ncbi:hypothetical protein [Acidiphilium acidophilum]|uniref:hypothetical protein n=1 Tax=Acidiphilium acidophilum TaxID=76588 RepID=UPI002E8E6E50|nr:hypothetical protein [Acidiphilium acidophilum]
MTRAKQGSTSFSVKKEAKKLLFAGFPPLKTPVTQIEKSFLLLFFKKEAFSLARHPCA